MYTAPIYFFEHYSIIVDLKVIGTYINQSLNLLVTKRVFVLKRIDHTKCDLN